METNQILHRFYEGFTSAWEGDVPNIGLPGYISDVNIEKGEKDRYIQFGGYITILDADLTHCGSLDSLLNDRVRAMGERAALLLRRSRKELPELPNYIEGQLIEGGVIELKIAPEGARVLHIVIFIKTKTDYTFNPFSPVIMTAGWKALLEVPI